MKKKVVLAALLLAVLLVGVAAGKPYRTETKIAIGTPEDPLGWGTWCPPDNVPPSYDYVLVWSDLTNVRTGDRQIRCAPCKMYRGGRAVLHSGPLPGDPRGEALFFHVQTDWKPVVYWGHIPDSYYTGYIIIKWVDEVW